MIVTVIFAGAIAVQMAVSLVEGMALRMVWPVVRGLLVDAAIAGLVFGGLIYQIARLGRFSRDSDTTQPAGDLTGMHATGACPGPLTVLIPSYREDVDVVRQTVLCAVLQDYPDRRVVICVDDPPDSTDAAARRALAAVRGLPGEITALLSAPARHAAAAERAFHHRQYFEPTLDMYREARVLAFEFRRAARWLEEQGGREAASTPTERLFVRVVFTDRAASCRAIAERLRARASADTLNDADVAAAYARLGSMFHAEVSTFERKRYVNTSHEPNKAMNLNSYIALMGNTYGEVRKLDGLHLRQLSHTGTARTAAPVLRTLDVPDATWLLTVDADSLLVHDYAARMVRLMREPEHARTAISQTPYSAVPGLTGRLERTAGHTTDIMYLVHQGSTHFDATYWVGANALIRMAALREIVTTGTERGHVVQRFIQDRTVIEDTESTVDLVNAGWSLHNYPARLAYSATPPDYGSLLIQRRRWANGGLLILPKLLRSYAKNGPRAFAQALLRLHYLTSIATVNVALLVLISVPLQTATFDLLLPGTCLPYFALCARDLRLSGHRRRELLGIYALNLLLLPVNLGGVIKSLQQAISRRRIPFGRTPKVAARTPAPPLYMASTLLLLALLVTATVTDGLDGRWSHAVASGVNTAILLAAITMYIGWRHVVRDLLLTSPMPFARISRQMPARLAAGHRRILRSSSTVDMAEPDGV